MWQHPGAHTPPTKALPCHSCLRRPVCDWLRLHELYSLPSRCSPSTRLLGCRPRTAPWLLSGSCLPVTAWGTLRDSDQSRQEVYSWSDLSSRDNASLELSLARVRDPSSLPNPAGQGHSPMAAGRCMVAEACEVNALQHRAGFRGRWVAGQPGSVRASQACSPLLGAQGRGGTYAQGQAGLAGTPSPDTSKGKGNTE